MSRQGIVASVLVLIAGCTTLEAGQRPNDAVRQAIEVLMAPGGSPIPGLKVSPQNPRGAAIRTLEADGSPAAVDGLLRFLTTAGGDAKLRMQSLVALGVVGTAEAIKALETFGAWAERRRIDPPPFRFGRHAYPVPHYSPTDVQPVARAAGADGRRWAILRLPLAAFRDDWWVVSSADGTTWSLPVLAGPSAEPETLVREIAAAGSMPASLTRDSDGDGLSDLMEARIGTNPAVADSDEDGVPDARDGSPLTPPHAPSDETEIRQRLFEALVATNDTRDVLLALDGTGLERQEFFGYSGWIVPAAERQPGRINLVGMEVKLTSPSTAEASITDWEGMLAASGHMARLEKKHGRWVLVQFGMAWIS